MPNSTVDYREKYLKYKNHYLQLQQLQQLQRGGADSSSSLKPCGKRNEKPLYCYKKVKDGVNPRCGRHPETPKDSDLLECECIKKEGTYSCRASSKKEKEKKEKKEKKDKKIPDKAVAKLQELLFVSTEQAVEALKKEGSLEAALEKLLKEQDQSTEDDIFATSEEEEDSDDDDDDDEEDGDSDETKTDEQLLHKYRVFEKEIQQYYEKKHRDFVKHVLDETVKESLADWKKFYEKQYKDYRKLKQKLRKKEVTQYEVKSQKNKFVKLVAPTEKEQLDKRIRQITGLQDAVPRIVNLIPSNQTAIKELLDRNTNPKTLYKMLSDHLYQELDDKNHRDLDNQFKEALKKFRSQNKLPDGMTVSSPLPGIPYEKFVKQRGLESYESESEPQDEDETSEDEGETSEEEEDTHSVEELDLANSKERNSFTHRNSTKELNHILKELSSSSNKFRIFETVADGTCMYDSISRGLKGITFPRLSLKPNPIVSGDNLIEPGNYGSSPERKEAVATLKKIVSDYIKNTENPWREIELIWIPRATEAEGSHHFRDETPNLNTTKVRKLTSYLNAISEFYDEKIKKQKEEIQTPIIRDIVKFWKDKVELARDTYENHLKHSEDREHLEFQKQFVAEVIDIKKQLHTKILDKVGLPEQDSNKKPIIASIVNHIPQHEEPILELLHKEKIDDISNDIQKEVEKQMINQKDNVDKPWANKISRLQKEKEKDEYEARANFADNNILSPEVEALCQKKRLGKKTKKPLRALLAEAELHRGFWGDQPEASIIAKYFNIKIIAIRQEDAGVSFNITNDEKQASELCGTIILHYVGNHYHGFGLPSITEPGRYQYFFPQKQDCGLIIGNALPDNPDFHKFEEIVSNFMSSRKS